MTNFLNVEEQWCEMAANSSPQNSDRRKPILQEWMDRLREDRQRQIDRRGRSVGQYSLSWINALSDSETFSEESSFGHECDHADIPLSRDARFKRIYLHTAGNSLDQDYAWIDAISKSSAKIDSRLFSSSIIAPLLVTSYSFVLGRSHGWIFLQVNGLRAEDQRSDERRRRIVFDLALGGASAYEDTVRGFAVTLLQELDVVERVVTEKVAWKPTSDLGFDVSSDFSQRLAEIAAPIEHGLPDLTPLVALNSGTMRSELAAELASCTLPMSDGPLVVVTERRPPVELARAGVWRGLTTLPPSSEETDSSLDWRNLDRQTPHDVSLEDAWQENSPAATPRIFGRLFRSIRDRRN